MQVRVWHGALPVVAWFTMKLLAGIVWFNVLLWCLPVLVLVGVVRCVIEDWPYLVGIVGTGLTLAFLTEIVLPWLFVRKPRRESTRH